MSTIEFPQEVIDQFVSAMKQKLPVEVDDAIIMDIIQTHIQIADEYLKSIENK